MAHHHRAMRFVSHWGDCESDNETLICLSLIERRALPRVDPSHEFLPPANAADGTAVRDADARCLFLFRVGFAGPRFPAYAEPRMTRPRPIGFTMVHYFLVHAWQQSGYQT